MCLLLQPGHQKAEVWVSGAYPATEGGGGGGLGRAVPRCRHIGCVVSHGAAAVSCCVVLCYAVLCCVGICLFDFCSLDHMMICLFDFCSLDHMMIMIMMISMFN